MILTFLTMPLLVRSLSQQRSNELGTGLPTTLLKTIRRQKLNKTKTIFRILAVLFIAGLLAISTGGCDRDEPPTAIATATVIINEETPPTIEETPQEPLPSTAIEIYWSEARIFSPKTSSIYRANADGTNVKRIVTRLVEATDIALDIAGLKLYWTDREAGKIQRANLVGTNVEDILTGLEDPEGLALDVAGSKLYWGESRKIWRANLDGTNVQDIVAGLDLTPGSIALDVAGGKIYWANWGLFHIQRANLDGTNIQDIVAVEYVVDIALDVVNGKLYGCVTAVVQRRGEKSEHIPGKILRANLNGTNVEDILARLNPRSIALDVAGGKIYWAQADERILRANLNGTNVENVVNPTKGHPVTDIALVLR